MIRVSLDSLGCKLNQAETELLARQLAEAGCRLVSATDEADVYILNTCTVTHIADRKSRHRLRLAHRQNPDAKLVAIGCYADWAPQELVQIDGVDLVLGNEQKPHLLQWLRESGYLGQPLSTETNCHYNGCRTRAFIKVQDGCSNSCTYCIVPLVRGSEQSVPVAQVVAEVRQRVADGGKEVVLTGTKIGSYKSDGVNLRGLLEHILTETDVIRLRLSSLQPQELSPELIGLWHDRRLSSHFHLSLQSGSDAVLSRMKRRYTTADYQHAVSLIRKVVPEAAITTDIIVGFPGETEAEFEESFNFCQQMEFARIHVFPYSLRRGTEAARMPCQVGDKVKKQRSQKMLALARESVQNFSRRFLDRTMPVLWEKQTDGIWSGLTDNYIKVYTESSEDLANQLLPVNLVEVRENGVWGVVL
ncbi:MAG: tRNA (N(6)-L-threonylcarbamoyladenosine(37)-C(2))-methylthiotransferase MtaB [Dehalococcoidales bacterium]